MAQVTSGTIKSGTNNKTYFYLNWQRTDYSVANNTSTISWQVGIGCTSGTAYWYSNAIKVKSVYINGVKVSDGGTWSNKTVTATSPVQLLSGTATISHNTDGNKTFNANLSAWLYSSFDTSASGDFELPTIPRYLAINSFTITNITETSALVSWSVSDPRDSTYYSLDGGATWIGSATYGESLASDGKSGSFNVWGLNAGTKYNIKIKIKRTDSQLWTESGSKSFSTYDYPYCTSTPNFTIGNALTISLYNPLKRSVTIKGIAKSNNTSIFGATNVTGTSVAGFNDSGSVTAQYNSIPNAKSGAYKVEVTYGSITKTRDNGNTYSIKGTEKPTVGTLAYEDSNADVVAITGNNQHIVQNKSILKALYNKATAKNGASISKYTLEVNGATWNGTAQGGAVELGTINSANDVNLTITVTDSRGLTASATKKVTILSYSAPTFTTSLKRLNNYEDTTYLKVDGSISSVNSKNKIVVLQYRYKLKDGSYGDYYSIEDNKEYTLTLNKENVYIFEIIIKDSFGTITVKTATLNKGVFPLFIDTEKNAVGINEFPREGEALRVKDGDIVLEKNSPKFVATNGSRGVSLHVGAGGINRGVYDETDKKWLIYNDDKDVYLNSNLYPMSRGYNNELKDTEIFDKVAEDGSLYRSGLYSVYDGTTWYNVINARHRNGHADGINYGFQIRSKFALGNPLEYRQQNNGTWSDWKQVETNSYSTTEQKIGTWVDGRAVYRRSFVGQLGNASATIITEALGSKNCEIIKSYGYLGDENNGMSLGGYINESWNSGLWTNTNSIQIWCSSALYGKSYKVTLEYLKRT